MGLQVLTVRRIFTGAALAVSAGTYIVFVNTETPNVAVGCICILLTCNGMGGAGFGASYLDVGGKDTGIMQAVGNMLATIPGIISPLFGAWVVATTGTWHLLFYSVSGVQCIAAFVYCINISK